MTKALNQRRKPTRRELLNIARRAGCPMRHGKGSHVVVHLPDGKIATIGLRPNSVHLDDQIRAFRRAGLL